VVPNRAVVDVGLSTKPFTAWRHEHRFEALGRGRTRLTDRITYRLPGGPMAKMVNKMVVGKRLAKSLAARQANTKTYLERPR
jgi:ligand-binding SRPBCC domain-containing protein